MATKFDTNDLNPGVWFKIDESDPESGEILIRTCGIDDIKEIRRKTLKRKRIIKNGHIMYDESFNEDLQNELTWDICIVDWKGIVDNDDKEIPCTKEMKMKFMGQSIKFAKRVTECIAELNEAEGVEEEEEEKN